MTREDAAALVHCQTPSTHLSVVLRQKADAVRAPTKCPRCGARLAGPGWSWGPKLIDRGMEGVWCEECWEGDAAD